MRLPWRRRLLVWAAAALCCSAAVIPAATAAGAAPAPAAAASAATPALQADFTDDFNGAAGSGVDTSKWSQETGDNGGNNHERQYYTSGTNNAAMDGKGHLVITARRRTRATTSAGTGPVSTPRRG